MHSFLYLIAFFVIVLALMVSVGRLMTPYLNKRLPDFEVWASQELHTPISIKKVELTWNVYEPELTLHKVEFLDATTRQPKIELQFLSINFAIFQSLIQRKVVIENIHADGAALTVKQNNQSQFTLEGLSNFEITDNFTGSSVQGNQVVDWIFSVPNLYLEHVDLHFIPLQGKPYFFTIKHLRIDNSLLEHTLDSSIRLNQELPTLFNLHLSLYGDISNIPKLSARFYLYAEGFNFSQWLKDYNWNHLELNQGIGSAKIWGEWDNNTLQKIHSTFQVYSLGMTSLISNNILEIPRLSGNVDWKKSGDSQTLSGDQLFIDLSDHLWPMTNFSLTWKTDPQGKLIPIEFSSRYMNVKDVKNILLDSGFLKPDVQKQLESFSPQGEIKNFHFKDSAVSMEFYDVSINAVGDYPGIQHLTGNITSNNNVADIFLNSPALTITLPTVFADPIAFDQVNGVVRTQKQDNGDWTITTQSIILANKDLKASSKFSLLIPAEGFSNIVLSSDFTLLKAEHITKYLPLKTFDKTLQDWLQNAFLSGQVKNGTAVLQGDLRDFPYDNGKGLFEIKGDVANVNFHYAPKWPNLNNLSGALDFKDRSMTADISSGDTQGIPLQQIHAVIPSMGGVAPEVLTVQGGPITTDFANGLNFIHASPLENTLGKQLGKMQLQGPISLMLKLAIPLKNPDAAKVNGQLTIQNCALNLADWKLSMNQMQGSLEFTENSLTAQNIQGKLFTSPVSLSFATKHTQTSSYVVATIKTSLDVPSIETWTGLSLSQYASGQTDINAVVNLPPEDQSSQPTQVNITSDLKGMSLKLPEGYGKDANETKSLDLQLQAQASGMTAKIQYENLVVTLEKELHDWSVGIESEAISGKVIVPTDKTIPSIKADFSRFYVSDNASVKADTINPLKIPAIEFVGESVHYGQKDFGRVVLNLNPLKNGVNISTLQVTTPTVNLTASGAWQILQDNRNISHVEGTLSTVRLTDALHEWGFATPSLIGKKASATFSLTWPNVIYAPSIKGMTGEVSFIFGEGRIINLSQSSNAQMDVGRLLNLFNLSTIPRRLTGDFSDVFQKGYAFDSIKGHFLLRNGSAFTPNTKLDGPIASVSLNGRIGIVAKDLDMNMSVTPYVTSGLPLVAAAAAPVTGGASLVVGAATWVADKLFVGKEVSKAITHRYHITGTWDNPEWRPVGGAQ